MLVEPKLQNHILLYLLHPKVNQLIVSSSLLIIHQIEDVAQLHLRRQPTSMKTIHPALKHPRSAPFNELNPHPPKKEKEHHHHIENAKIYRLLFITVI